MVYKFFDKKKGLGAMRVKDSLNNYINLSDLSDRRLSGRFT